MNEDFLITDESIEFNNGIIEYFFEDDCAVVNQISVYRTGEGIGSALIDRFEKLAIENDIHLVEVPISPSKQALSFWFKRGYRLANDGDNQLVTTILKNDFVSQL